MTYDDDGNVITKVGHGHTQSFTWNGLGQLMEVVTDGITTSFGYDGLGRRARKTSNGVITRYLYDGENLIMQLSGAGEPQLEFSYYPGVDRPHAVRQSATGTLLYYMTNATGHVTGLVNQSNQVVNQYAYTPFGQAITTTEQVAQPFRFAGRELDTETGLYYNRARYYDPSLARFLSEDPIGLADGANQYTYAHNDPVNYRDPSGTCELWERYTLITDAQTGAFISRTPSEYFWKGDDCGGPAPDLTLGREFDDKNTIKPKPQKKAGGEPKFHLMMWRAKASQEGCPARIFEQFQGHHGQEVWDLKAAGKVRWMWKKLSYLQSYGGTFSSKATNWHTQSATGQVYCDLGFGTFQTMLPPGW